MHAGVDLRHGQVLLFSKFAHLYDAGVPLAEALSLVSGELGESLGPAVRRIVDDIHRGMSLADAMEQRPELFSPELVGVIRAGEQRGELGATARSAAAGLEGRVLNPVRVPQAHLDALLERAGDARILHLDPDGRLRVRRMRGLEEVGEADVALGPALARRAGPGGGFMWNDRLVRVASTATTSGPATVVRLSGPPGPEPPGARRWREGPPGLLLVVGGDVDARLRSVLAAFDPETTRRVAVDLPVPEVLCVATIDAALSLDPDVACVARLELETDARRLAGCGRHVVAGALRAFEDVPHALLDEA